MSLPLTLLGCAVYSIWCWLNLLEKTDHLKQYKKLYLSGDTGSGFRSYVMALFLTFAKERFDKEVEVHHLCPRHAYNICDPAGGRYVIPSRLCRGVQVSQATTLMIFTVLGSSVRFTTRF
jgi:hypothetical protein